MLVPPIFRCRWDWRVMMGAVWIAGLALPITLLGASRYEWLLKLPPLQVYIWYDFGQPVLKRTSAWLAPVTAAILVACYGSGWFPGSLIEHGLFAPLMGCVLWGLTRGGGWFAALLGSKPLVYLGEISYGIYIFQFPVFVGCFAVTKKLRLPGDSRAAFLVCSAILVGVSAVSFELAEKPLSRSMMRCYDRRQSCRADRRGTLLSDTIGADSKTALHGSCRRTRAHAPPAHRWLAPWRTAGNSWRATNSRATGHPCSGTRSPHA